MRRIRIFRTLGVMLLLFLLATAMYAFTAANTVDDSKAGIGDGDISGYDVSNVTYTFADDASFISAVTFDLDEAATSVRIRFNGTGAWTSCSQPSEAESVVQTWTCAVNQSTLDAESLEVAAAD